MGPAAQFFCDCRQPSIRVIRNEGKTLVQQSLRAIRNLGAHTRRRCPPPMVMVVPIQLLPTCAGRAQVLTSRNASGGVFANMRRKYPALGANPSIVDGRPGY